MPTTTGTSATLTPASAREVAIVMEASASFSRGVLEGVSRWIGEHEGWMITIDDREPGVPIPGWLLRWDVHGVISGLGESSLPRGWRAGQRPVVHVRRRMPAAPLPGVYPDDEAAVRLGVEHLAERGVRHLVFSPGPSAAMKGLCDVAVHHAAALGCRLDIQEPRRPAVRRRDRGDEDDSDAFARWLASLPKPLGVLAASDVLAVRIIEACRRGRLAVPDDVAVVGIGD
ncbi:MAG: substrate-binding domain-containing protein, partial [Planctomycetota bacterium]